MPPQQALYPLSSLCSHLPAGPWMWRQKQQSWSTCMSQPCPYLDCFFGGFPPSRFLHDLIYSTAFQSCSTISHPSIQSGGHRPHSPAHQPQYRGHTLSTSPTALPSPIGIPVPFPQLQETASHCSQTYRSHSLDASHPHVLPTKCSIKV